MQEAVESFTRNRSTFNIKELRTKLNEIHDESEGYFNDITPRAVKRALLRLFETGNIPGYCIKTRPIIGERGPFHIIEFAPENPMSSLDLLQIPNRPKRTICHLDKDDKDLLIAMARKMKCTQDTLARSLLVQSLELLVDAKK